MRILIAPNAFKNSLPASAVARAIEEGMLQAGFTGDVTVCPVGDGGDGTGALLEDYWGARKINCECTDALQRTITASYGWVDCSSTAIIELADASGIKLLKPAEYDPLKANTRGSGKMIRAALDQGAKNIILCIGGSATIDGGSGLLKELGYLFYDIFGNPIEDIPEGLIHLGSVDAKSADSRLQQTEIIILCDVKNKLLGEKGAAAVFGPQKGASGQDVFFLERCLSRFNQIALKCTGIDMNGLHYSGAAGGVAASLQAFCNAKAVAGIDYVLDALNFDELVLGADAIITGEGSIDDQTAFGKAPFGVALAAKKRSKPVIGVAGKIELSAGSILHQYFDRFVCINDGVSLTQGVRFTRENLIKAGAAIAVTLQKVI